VEAGALPARPSGKVDRDALPCRMPPAGAQAGVTVVGGTQAVVQELWSDILGVDVADAKADFFDLGGSSLTAAQLVSRLRQNHPEITVADVYDAPTLEALAARIEESDPQITRVDRRGAPVPVQTPIRPPGAAPP